MTATTSTARNCASSPAISCSRPEPINGRTATRSAISTCRCAIARSCSTARPWWRKAGSRRSLPCNLRRECLVTGWTTKLIGPAPRLAVDHQGQGELVLFMHGIGGNRTNWHDQLPACAARFHAVAWDARGYGLSDDYPGPLSYDDFCHDILRVLDHFGARKAHLVGLSMGGF